MASAHVPSGAGGATGGAAKGTTGSPVGGTTGGTAAAQQTLGSMGEFAVIDAMTATMPTAVGVEVGPGDDAAVVHAPDGRVVVSCDMFVDGVHFRSDWAAPEQIGRRCAIAAVADICAMGAMPTALVIGLAAPADTPTAHITELGAGLAAAAAELGAGVVGGDLTSADRLTIAVTVFGDMRGARPVLRSGARPGDVVALAGRIGWAAAGLAVLSRGFRSPVAVVGAYKVPEPPLSAGPIAAVMGATAMIDVSDGLLADVGHIAAASGVGIDISSAALVVPPRLAEVASALGKDALTWLLTGGDDHALVATFPAGSDLPAPWQQIGIVTTAPAAGAAAVTVDGAVYDGDPGYQHFR
ncbi:MAG: thiamine-phosphate kinase [Actinobacteria bacterium]|nr:thiamine-phosphate kinase [Actinomycetota bacterium]